MKKWIFIAMIFIFFSCEKQQDWSFDEGPLPDIVVDAMFTNESKSHEVFLSLPSPDLEQGILPLTGAVVQIHGPDTIFVLQEDPLRPGYYLTDSAVYGLVNKKYTLEVQYNSKSYFASDTLLPAVLFSPLQLSLYNDDDSTYRISWVCSNYSPNNPALYEVLLDWRHLDGFDSAYAQKTLYYYTLTSLDVGQFLTGPDQNVIIPKGTKIRERRYSISKEYAAFLREILIETQFNNGLVNMIPANTIGNVSNNGAGFFSCGGVVEYIGVAGD